MSLSGSASYNTNAGIKQLMLTLEKVAPMMKDREEDLGFVKDVVQSNDFRSLMHIHNEVKNGSTKTDEPVTKNAVAMSHQVCYHLEGVLGRETSELFDLLSSPHIYALLLAHDRVANKEYPATLLAKEQENDKERKQFRHVRIERNTAEPLGATIKLNKDGFVVISRILHRSLADRSGILHPGDIVHTINGWTTRGNDIDTVADHMQDLTGMIEMLISTSQSERPPSRRTTSITRMKAHFEYNPKTDQHLPCPEAGLAFNRGAILFILNQDDPDWWQAVHDGGSKDLSAGLIPSTTFIEKLEYDKLRRKLLFDKQRKPFTLKRKRVGAHKKLKYDPHVNEDYHCGEILSYEEVVKIAPQKNRPRPVVLVGPQGGAMDFEALIDRLIADDEQKFARPLRYYSKPPASPFRKHRILSEYEIEQCIRDNELVEYEKTSRYYAGTSTQHIKEVMQASKTCVMVIQPQFLKLIRSNSELKPFVVFFRTPDSELMRNKWKPLYSIGVQEMRHLIQQGIDMEVKYTHLFDELIIFTDHDEAYQNLLTTCQRLRDQFQWVPSSWVKR